jgi:hypothetical protein
MCQETLILEDLSPNTLTSTTMVCTFEEDLLKTNEDEENLRLVDRPVVGPSRWGRKQMETPNVSPKCVVASFFI